MNFQVPQFIEVEDKVFGPLSFRQFLYLAGGGGLGYIIYAVPTVLPAFIRIVLAIIPVGIGIALAFYKVNNQSFINIVESAFWFYTHDKLYIWKKNEKPMAEIEQLAGKKLAKTEAELPTLSRSRLKDLSWSLDVNEKIK